MLIIHRHVGQRIVLSGGLEVTVTAVTRKGVRLAIVAPRGISILRGETYDAVAKANAEASPEHRYDPSTPPSNGVTIEGTKFGTIEVAAHRQIVFSQGIVGFPEETRFVLLQGAEGTSSGWLQSLRTPGLALPVVDGGSLGIEYPVPGTADLAREAGIEDSEFAVLVVVVARTGADTLTANLLAPIIVGVTKGQATQVILDPRHFSSEFPLPRTAHPQVTAA